MSIARFLLLLLALACAARIARAEPDALAVGPIGITVSDAERASRFFGRFSHSSGSRRPRRRATRWSV
jgi:hypothetical protein